MVDEQRLRLEPEGAEHRDERLLVGDDLDDELRQSEPGRLDNRVARERPPHATAAPRRVHADPHLADVARPAVQRDHGDVSEHRVVIDGDRARVARPRPGGHDVGVGDVLLQERAVGVRDAVEEALERRAVGGLYASDLHGVCSVSRRSLCAVIHSVIRGIVCLKADLPVPKVTWPPGRRRTCRRAGSRTIASAGSVAPDGTTLSRSAIATSTSPRTRPRSTTRSPTRIRPLMRAFSRTSSSATSRNAAPGNGTWSRDHCAIAWKPSTNWSFQRFSSSVALWAISLVGASM